VEVGSPGPKEGGSRGRNLGRQKKSREAALSTHRSGLVVFRVSLDGIP